MTAASGVIASPPIGPSVAREAQLAGELAAVREQLAAAEAVLRAIRSGDVDALMVGGPLGDRVVRLVPADDAYRRLVDEIDQGAVTLSTDGTIVYANGRFAAMVGVPADRIVGSSIYRFIPFKDVRTFDGLLASGGRAELSIWTTSGPLIPARVAVLPMLDGDLLGARPVIVTDLRAQPPPADALELAKLRASLREKEVLLKEIHHRVKNNLQIIASLLNLQSDALKDADAVRLLQESQHRIRSMALVHERLYASEDLSSIDMRSYLSTLVEQLMSSCTADALVHAAVEAEAVRLDIDRAIPCGLIVNELVSNAIKHAFPNERPGRIVVRLRPCGTGAQLSVEDTGVGLPDELALESSPTLGLRLVSALCEQLGATLRIERRPGAGFHITWPA